MIGSVHRKLKASVQKAYALEESARAVPTRCRKVWCRVMGAGGPARA